MSKEYWIAPNNFTYVKKGRKVLWRACYKFRWKKSKQTKSKTRQKEEPKSPEHPNTKTLRKKGEMKNFICRKGLANVAAESGEGWSRKNHKWWYEQTILPRNLNILDVRAKNVKTETLGWKMKAAGNRAKIISLRLIDPRSQASKRFFS